MYILISRYISCYCFLLVRALESKYYVLVAFIWLCHTFYLFHFMNGIHLFCLEITNMQLFSLFLSYWYNMLWHDNYLMSKQLLSHFLIHISWVMIMFANLQHRKLTFKIKQLSLGANDLCTILIHFIRFYNHCLK